MRRVFLEFTCHKEILRKPDEAAMRRGAGLDGAGGIDHIRLDKRGTDILPPRQKESVRHAPAKDQRIDPRHQIFQHLKLGRYLGPADNRRHRTRRVGQRAMQRRQLFTKRAPRRCHLHHAGKRLDRGMGAVRAGKGVADIDVAKRGQRRGKAAVIRFFTGMETQIFHHHDIAILQPVHRRSGSGAGNVGFHRHITSQQAGKTCRHRRHRHLGDKCPFRPPEMRQDHQPRAGRAKRLQPRHNAPDSCVIADRAIGERHIQIKPDEAALAGGLNLVNEQKGGIHKKILI